MGDAGTCGQGGELDPRWLQILRESMGHRPYALVARRSGPDGDICGYLPLALVAGRLFGRFLVSLPYLNRGGLVADDANIADTLIDQAVALGEKLNVQYLELRHSAPVEHATLPQGRNEKVRMVMELPGSGEALWQALSAKVRNQIRKGDRHELKVRWGGVPLLHDFYSVFCQNMRDLGTPVYPRRLFERVLEHFEGVAELAIADWRAVPVAAALLIHGRELCQVPSASSLRRHNDTCANMWLYHKLLERGIERGARQFDFGRSSEGSGTYKFKKQWGAEPCPTVWQYHVFRGEAGQLRPDAPKYRRRVAAWQKLPVWLTRWVGPVIVRGIP